MADQGIHIGMVNVNAALMLPVGGAASIHMQTVAALTIESQRADMDMGMEHSRQTMLVALLKEEKAKAVEAAWAAELSKMAGGLIAGNAVKTPIKGIVAVAAKGVIMRVGVANVCYSMEICTY